LADLKLTVEWHSQELNPFSPVEHTGFWWRNLSQRDHLKDLGVDGRVALKYIIKKWNGEAAAACECGNEP
jgi:hypothetical protein